MSTVRETIQDLTYNGEPLRVITGNPFFPDGSDRSKDIVLIPFTDGGAVTCAEAMCEANHRVLEEEWGHLESFTTHGGGFSLLIALFLDEEAPDDLEDVIKSLEDYPVLCDQMLSEVEHEWIEECWNMYGRDEVRYALRDSEGVTDEQIDNAAEEYVMDCEDWYLEGDSLVFDAASIASLIVK